MNDTDTTRQGATYQAVRIGDIADWRLLASISSRGVSAWLKHVDPVQPLVPLLQTEWKDNDTSLLENIENAVYDNPQVLDDFSADIVIVAPRAIWVPTSLVADDDDEAVRLYNQVYSAEPDDVMSEAAGEATCLYSLVPGLNSFLMRTFPGARVHSHIAVDVNRLRERGADMPRVYIDIRSFAASPESSEGGEADFIVYDRNRLTMAATHRWHNPDDIKYHLFNIMQVFGLDPVNTQVSLSGESRLKTELVRDLRQDISFVMMTMVPTIGAKANLPLPVSLLLRR